MIDVITEPGEIQPLEFYGEYQDSNILVNFFDGEFYETSKGLPKVKFNYGYASMEVTSSKTIDCSGMMETGAAFDIGKLVVKSAGDVPVKPVVTFSGDNADMFRVEPAEPVEIAAGDSVEYAIMFNALWCSVDDVYPADLSLTDAYGEAGPINDVTIRGVALTAAQDTVCIKRDRMWYVPINTNKTTSHYPESQFIYPAEKLTAHTGRRITSIKFFAEKTIQAQGGLFQLSLKETDRTIFTDPGVDKITDMTVAATASIGENTSEIEFVFPEPITYHGGNLAVEVLTVEHTSGYGVHDPWLGEYQDETTAYHKYKYGADSEEKDLYYCLPMAKFSTVQAEPVFSMEVTTDKTIDCIGVIGNNAVLKAGKLVVTNSGNQPVKPVVAFTGSWASLFAIEPAELAELAAGSSVEYTITLHASTGTDASDYTAGITIADEYRNAATISDVTVNAEAVASNVDIVCDFLRHEEGWIHGSIPFRCHYSIVR